MGEYAEDLMDGTCCQYCGVFHDDVFKEPLDEPFIPQGFPWTCSDCKEDDNNDG